MDITLRRDNNLTTGKIYQVGSAAAGRSSELTDSCC